MRIRALIVIGLMMTPQAATASFLSDVGGIFTDPLKVSDGTENILRAVDKAAIHAERIAATIDSSVEARLTQIDLIVQNTIANTAREANGTIDIAEAAAIRTLTEVNNIQNSIFQNTRDTIKCSIPVTTDQLKQAMADSLNHLGVTRPRITLFGWFELFAVEFTSADFPSPKDAFNRYRFAIEDEIATYGPDTPARLIADAYGEIQRTADLARCHHKDDSITFIELYNTELEYVSLARPWIGQYDPDFRQ